MLATVMWLLLADAGAFEASSRAVLVSRVAQDQTDAVLPDAQVALFAAASATRAQTVASDPSGLFRFERVPSGTYKIRAEFSGFEPATSVVRVGRRAPGMLTLVMTIEGITEELSVTSGGTTLLVDGIEVKVGERAQAHADGRCRRVQHAEMCERRGLRLQPELAFFLRVIAARPPRRVQFSMPVRS